MAIKTASVLAFERKLANSDAFMFAGRWDDINSGVWQPIHIQEKAVRGTISNRQPEAKIQNANLQLVDVAALPMDADTLKVTFTLRVLGNLSTPSACNDQEYQVALQNVIEGYISEHGFTELAARYAVNLANGRFLWRNRVGAEAIKVHISSGEQRWTFDAQHYSLREFCQPDGDLQALAQVIESGLRGDSFALLTVEAFVQLGAGQEVFPSQELLQSSDKSNKSDKSHKSDHDSKSKKSKVLYQVSDVAAMHSQKIGNALRTIDTWHPMVDSLGAIAVEPYGSVTNRGVACRQPKEKMDFYTLLDKWVIKGDKPALEQQHYVMAVLIRGGVFGGGKDD